MNKKKIMLTQIARPKVSKRDIEIYQRAQEVVGKKAMVPIKVGNYNIGIEVIIKGFNKTYGRDRYFVAPILGKGTMWVEDPEIIA